MKKIGTHSDEKQGMTAEEIRQLREQERMDSVYDQQTVSKRVLFTSLNYLAAFAAGAAILVALYYENMLVSWLRSEIAIYLWMIDDSSSFLADAMAAVLHLLIYTLAAVLFGFALDINYAGHGRPKEVWGRYVRFILPAAFGSCLLYVAIHHFTYTDRYKRAVPFVALLCDTLFHLSHINDLDFAAVFFYYSDKVIRMHPHSRCIIIRMNTYQSVCQ